ncbi:MAG: hypothetical protein U0Y08_06885 [Bacteroidia bacterium]
MFITKIVAAILLYIIYTRFYTDRAYADIFRYYDDAAVMYNALTTHPGHYFSMLTGIGAGAPELQPYYDTMRNWYNTDLVFNDSRTMIRINAFLRLFTMGTYFPHAVVMCFLAMIGLTGIFRRLNQLAPGRAFLLTVMVYLLPSTLLWTSGMIKETFLVFALGNLLYQSEKKAPDNSPDFPFFMRILISVFLMLTVKVYVFFLFVPVILVALLADKISLNKWVLNGIVFSGYLALLALAAPLITSHNLPVLIADKQAEFYNVASTEQAKSLMQIDRIEPEWPGLLLAAPGAFFRSLLVPMPWQAHNFLMWFSVAENLFIVLLILIMVFAVKKEYVVALSPSVIALFLFGCLIFVLSGWVTPIIGALVRYKAPGLPFVLFIFAALSQRKWMSGQWLSLYRKQPDR